MIITVLIVMIMMIRMRPNLTKTFSNNYKFTIINYCQKELFNKENIFSKKTATLKLIIAVAKMKIFRIIILLIQCPLSMIVTQIL
jgi:hypothetical protein